ncbi:MAG: leucine--tRNA ligase [Candidatus Ryanbacteria bacterium RIFCSPHIGHO2_02_FULL_45_13b]|uniref:Leucine--tRNA ligase n=1 Tax=Candidatus Ryanbacteria bacterium RIFCSPHIGHO2_02_FULL_45_13b TaxID=1802117 RepID=A0A1G2G865_9BACT|nr:MAG: leucine--tRNA ligase [Candidatus Ryanbacteria bacterium RIFCSPHIGHO2_02_FULL_45_13b]
MSRYNHQKIEKKWQAIWEKKKIYHALDGSKKKEYYAMIEFPYPSGDGLHVGHVRSYTAMDIVARKRRMEGYNTLYPIGWDAFGLPTENYAIKTKIHPRIVTKRNTDTFRRQLKSLGFSFDWDREINTTDPAYYKWTQWIFLKLFEAGLAYKAKTTINWCPKDKIGLANEEVVGGACERCGTAVEKREKEQWMLRITAYAEKLLKGLETVDYIPEAKTQQEHWIGKSEGALLKFKIVSSKQSAEVEVFTTRADTLFGATYIVLAPEHELVTKLEDQIINYGEVKKYIFEARKKTDMERTAESKEKTGAELKGITAINPANKKEIPVWISDYVLAGYGTGAIMAVPAHDERDFTFAKKFSLSIIPVIEPETGEVREGEEKLCYAGEGKLINSGKFDGMLSEKAKSEITQFVGGKITTKYKLRDWVFSRQRYWGEPIPLVYCQNCAKEKKFKSAGEKINPGWIPALEKNLPVELPNVKNYMPTDTGESPLANIKRWVKVKCPRCKGEAHRETDVMPNWAGSSWYFLRYTDPKNKKAFADAKKLKYWTAVDWYNGGMEHTVLHLLYSRFWNQFLFDQKLVPTREPYKKRTSHGLIMGEGGIKMSKSKGNVVNPDSVVKEFGADALRLYEMFLGPFNQPVAWDPRGIVGMERFLERVWLVSTEKKFVSKIDDPALETLLHKTIKKVSEDIESMAFNTAVSACMVFTNECVKREQIQIDIWRQFVCMLASYAPHIAEELWSQMGGKKSVHLEPWPKYDRRKIIEETFTLVVQVNGKVRDSFEVPQHITQKEAETLALARSHVKQALGNMPVKRVIFVPGRLVNIVI